MTYNVIINVKFTCERAVLSSSSTHQHGFRGSTADRSNQRETLFYIFKALRPTSLLPGPLIQFCRVALIVAHVEETDPDSGN